MAIQVNIDTNEIKVGLDNVIYMEDGGHGIPVGGTTNQALIKKHDLSDYFLSYS